MDIKLLIVDPASDLSDTLRDHLALAAPTWSVTHSPSIEDAELVASMAPFDALIVTGAVGDDQIHPLLEAVQGLQPDCIRLVLASVDMLEAPEALVSLCHRVLVQPCDPFTLQMAVEHTRRLRDTLGRSGVRALGLRRRARDSKRPTGDLLSQV